MALVVFYAIMGFHLSLRDSYQINYSQLLQKVDIIRIFTNVNAKRCSQTELCNNYANTKVYMIMKCMCVVRPHIFQNIPGGGAKFSEKNQSPHLGQINLKILSSTRAQNQENSKTPVKNSICI